VTSSAQQIMTRVQFIQGSGVFLVDQYLVHFVYYEKENEVLL
jgi:hypothetical protein